MLQKKRAAMTKRPFAAALLGAGIAAVILSPLIMIAGATEEITRTGESGDASVLIFIFRGLPLAGAVVAGAVCMQAATMRIAMRRAASAGAIAMVVLLLAFLVALNSGKTLILHALNRPGVDQSMIETVVEGIDALDALVPTAFGICGVGAALFVVWAWRFSRPPPANSR